VVDSPILSEFPIRNGQYVETLLLQASDVLDEVRPREMAAPQDPLPLITHALNEPILSRSLEELASGASNAVVICDDMTRPTPAHLLVPAILSRLNAGGLPDSAITILIATGTHRPMTREELEAKLGASVLERVRVVNHDHSALNELVSLGDTASGVPITVNRRVAEADVVVAVGNIVPHRYCGWAGGAKIIQPGVSGEATTAATHLMITRDPLARLGEVENTVRREIELVADSVGLDFIVNTVLDDEQALVSVVAGDFRAAFRRGVELAREVFGASFTARADIVVASAYPSDINLWQAGKALYAADLVVRDQGLIILSSPCTEGVGEHGSFAELIALDADVIERRIAGNEVSDRISAAAALAVALVRERAEIWLASSGISVDEARRMRMRRFDTTAEAVKTAMAERPGSRVTLLHNATEVLPIGTEARA
jgi:lactate racemase